MKILHVGSFIPNSGFGQYNSIVGLANGLTSIGCRVALLSSTPKTLLYKKDIPKNLVLLPSPQKNHLNPWKLSEKWIKITEKKIGRPDIVNFHSLFVPFHCALARLLEKKSWPYIITPRGTLSPIALNTKFTKKKIGKLLFIDHFINNSIAIHALCQNEAKDIQNLYPKNKVFVVPNAVDEDLLSLSNPLKPREIKEFYENKGLILGFMGRIDVYHKGIDLLLLALKKLQEQDLGKNIQLLMTGPFHTTNDEHLVKKLINSLKFPDRVTLTGPAYGDNKWKRLMACDIFVHTSRFEGMPMSVIEAMAIGKPCLVTLGSNMQNIISTCNGGWLCDESVDSIADTIIQIKKQEILKRGINAKKYIKEHLTWPTVAQQYVKKIKKINTNN